MKRSSKKPLPFPGGAILFAKRVVTIFDDYIASHFKRADEQEEGITFNLWKLGPYPAWGMPALRASKAASLQGKEK